LEFSFDNFAKEGLHEECGVFGIFSDGTINPAYACYNGLLSSTEDRKAAASLYLTKV
jgi:amidophosphoribosyltransferase